MADILLCNSCMIWWMHAVMMAWCNGAMFTLWDGIMVQFEYGVLKKTYICAMDVHCNGCVLWSLDIVGVDVKLGTKRLFFCNMQQFDSNLTWCKICAKLNKTLDASMHHQHQICVQIHCGANIFKKNTINITSTQASTWTYITWCEHYSLYSWHHIQYTTYSTHHMSISWMGTME